MADGRHPVALIAPLATLGRADEVALRVGQAVRLGLLAEGEQLPPETAFAARLGVSAMTLREALAVLRQQGVLETRRGRAGGTFVRRPAAPALRLLRERLLGLTAAELRDLADEQSAVGGAAARLAAIRASTAGVRRLRALADGLAGAASPAERVMADSRFHVEVAVAAGSERLTALEVALQATLAELRWLPADAESVRLDLAAATAEHTAIAAAIEAEDGSQARLLAEEHAERDLARLTAIRLSLLPHP